MNARFARPLHTLGAVLAHSFQGSHAPLEGRVRALEKMREQRAQRIKRQGKARIHVETAEQSGRKVCEMRNVSHGYGEELLLDKLKLKIMRGDRIGLIGNNGVGKSTLLKILLGMIQPDTGSVKLGTNLEIAYFDQVKRELDAEKSIAENVGLGRDYIKVNGKDRHVIGYLQNFLFAPKRAMTPVKALSGGERNRVSLAKLFSQPSNLLVLDEPTNDLDIEMLEVLEDRLVGYEGTLLIVSHDREFLDNVVTSILVFEADGKVHEYVGGYSDWARRGKSLRIGEDADEPAGNEPANNASAQGTAQNRKKLSYRLQRELDALPAEIEQLEAALCELQATIAKPEFYDQAYESTQPVLERLATMQTLLERKTTRWLELEDMGQG